MWLADNYPEIYDIPTHRLITKDRKTKTGGGVGLCITKNIAFEVREDFSIFREEKFESICVELKLNDKNKALIAVIYRAPNNKINDSDSLESFLININKDKKCSYGILKY